MRNAILCISMTSQKQLSPDPSLFTASKGPRCLRGRDLLGRFRQRDIGGQIKALGCSGESADTVSVSSKCANTGVWSKFSSVLSKYFVSSVVFWERSLSWWMRLRAWSSRTQSWGCCCKLPLKLQANRDVFITSEQLWDFSGQALKKTLPSSSVCDSVIMEKSSFKQVWTSWWDLHLWNTFSSWHLRDQNTI